MVNESLEIESSLISTPSPLNLNGFPIEILIIVLSYVDPLTLKNLPFVCKTWYNILKDDTIWNKIFKLHFPIKNEIFPSISRCNKFKTELLIRNQLKFNYRRGKLINKQFQINQILTCNSISIDWINNRLTIIDIPREIFLNCDLRNGKSTKFITDFVPEGITSYDSGTLSNSIVGSKALIFGRWDGSIFGSLINWKGLILSDAHNWGLMPGGRITCVTACINSSSSSSSSSPSLLLNNSFNLKLNYNNKILMKSNNIGAFSTDESNNLYGWDIKFGNCLFKYKILINSKVLKLQSDGKSVLIILFENSEIYVVRNIFKSIKNSDTKIEIFKIGNLLIDRNGLINLNLFVDYGNESIIVWNHLELSILSYSNINNNNNNNNNKLSYKVKENQIISFVSFESNDKLFIKRDVNIVGSDPLLAAICLNNGIIEIVNIRETLSSSNLIPINSIRPKFLTENENNRNNRNNNENFEIDYLDQSICKIASICINSMVIGIANHFGKVEIYDILTGDFLRIVIDKISKRKIQEIENLFPNRILNCPIKLYIDELNTRGLLIFGNFIQYFKCCNNSENDSDEEGNKKNKNKKIGNDRKGNFNEDVQFNLDIYEEEKKLKKIERDLFVKYNGTNENVNELDEQDQLNMALVMSMSLNENGKDQNDLDDEEDEDDDLEKALKLSLLSSSKSSLVPSSSSRNNITNSTNDDELDEDLLRAIELSKLENNKDWGPEDQWEKLT